MFIDVMVCVMIATRRVLMMDFWRGPADSGSVNKSLSDSTVGIGQRIHNTSCLEYIFIFVNRDLEKDNDQYW